MLQLHQQHQHQTQQQQHQLATETITIGKRFNAQLHCDRKVNTENRKRNKRSTLERAGSKEPQAVSEFMANGKMANKKVTNKKKGSQRGKTILHAEWTKIAARQRHCRQVTQPKETDSKIYY